MNDYRIWAAGSALAAGITAVLAKKGVEGVPSNLAMAIRVAFVVIFAWAVAGITREAGGIGQLTAKNWWALGLSAVGTGASWICYFKALQLGEVQKVAPIDKLSFVIAMLLGVLILKEKPSPYVWGGATLIIAGVLLTLKG